MTSSPQGAGRRRPVLVPAAAALAAGGLGVTAFLGGFNEASAEPPRQLSPGDVFDQGQFRTQFIKATDTIEEGNFGSQKRYLDLVVKVTNLGEETASVGLVPDAGMKPRPIVGFGGSVLRTRPVLKPKFGTMAYVLSYGIKSQQLQPGITTTVVIRYQLEPTDPAVDKLSVDLGSFVWQRVGIRDQTKYWHLIADESAPDDSFVPAVTAQITLPVRRERA
jgi:hypothetical protein